MHSGGIASNVSSEVVTAVAHSSAVLFSTLSIGSWSLIIFLLYLYSQGKEKSWGSPSNIGILFFSLLVTFVADFVVGNGGKHTTTNVYMLLKLIVVGILVCYFGVKYLFTFPSANQPPLGHHHKNISLIVWLITILLMIIETVEVIAELSGNQLSALSAIVNFAAILQKLLQGWLYHFRMSRKVPSEGKSFGVVWYLKLMALFNFSMWIQSIIAAESDWKVPDEMVAIDKAYSVIAPTYFALMIDYRLLCCLLFLEHAHEIQSQHRRQSSKDKDVDAEDKRYVMEMEQIVTENCDDDVTGENIRSVSFYNAASRMQKFGFLVGLVLLGTQFVNALSYLPHFGHEVNIFGIIAEVSVIIQGIIFISQVRKALRNGGKWRETNSKGVDLMVSLMGVTGLAFWLFKTILLITWSRHKHNDECYEQYVWNTVKSSFRVVSCLFSIYLYMRTDHKLGCLTRIKFRMRNHFIIPCLMMAYLSVFLNSVIDSYNKAIKKEMKNSHMSIVLHAFYEAGIPIHLGFCLHMSIHFLLMFTKMRDSLEQDRVVAKSRDPGERRRCHSMDEGGNIFGDKNDVVERLLVSEKNLFRTV